MSYCRWSTDINDNKQSDLYVYEDVMGGYTIHVASRRRVIKTPIPQYDGDNIMDWHVKRNQWIKDNNTFEDINGPFDGESWHGISFAETLEVLKLLEQAGYNFPSDLIDNIIENHYDTDEKNVDKTAGDGTIAL